MRTVPHPRSFPRVVVVGGGISGLTTAYLARAAGHDAICVDPAGQAGGLIRSERHEGFLCEVGPQAVLDDAGDTMALLDALNLTSRAVRATPEARRRFIYARGVLHPLPMSPPALLRSRLLSPLGKLRLLREPFVRARRADVTDDAETVEAFGTRRLGREAARTLLNTAVIGIYAADAAEISLASAFPRLAALEREHGSLFRGVLAGRKRGKVPGRPLSFPEGLGEMTAALQQALGTAGLVRGRVASLERSSGAWRVHIEGNTATTLDADAVVLTTDAETAARVLQPAAPAVSQALTGLPTAPIALCWLGFRDATGDNALGMDLSAYGFLVARGQSENDVRLLGCQYESSIFAGRAPNGGVLLRAILGGSGAGFEPDIVDKTDDEIAARAIADLRTIAGLKRVPDFVRVWKHPTGIPQYRPGHAARVATIDDALARHTGLFVLGHAVRGVGVNECIRAATTLVRDRLGAPA
jgi:oxygen-dependent protoporphyrinogen oxidase